MKKPKVEPYYLIVFPTNTDGGKALDLLRKDGPVHGVECAGQAAVVASRSQLRKLTRAGIHWAYIKTKSEEKPSVSSPARGERNISTKFVCYVLTPPLGLAQ